MKATQQYSVRARLPESLEPLRAIAMNLAWITFERAEDLFHQLDHDQGDFDGLDPISKLARASRARLDELASDPSFVARASALLEDLQKSLELPRWFQLHHEGVLQSVGYFSPEYGIAQALPQYSGGLGVLAGDHLKSATDLGIPLTAVGLLYRHGYFSQSLDPSGWQREYFPYLDPTTMSLTPLEDVRVQVPIADRMVEVKAWEARVGRIPLYLLDTDVPENSDSDRLITDRLYGGDAEQRVRQEIILGIGGMRLLEAVDALPQVFHMNEGHAGFLALERMRRLIRDQGLTLDEAVEAVRPGNVFTTHTPVPAGIDRFTREVVETYFSWWCDECNVTIDELMALGHEPGTAEGTEFNMAMLGLRVSSASNGVSALHGEVSRRMFAGLWPGVPEDERPIGAVTNGVHAHTWVSREMNGLLDRHIGHDWPEASEERWESMSEVPDEQLRAVRASSRDRLVRFVRHRLRSRLLAEGASPSETEWTERVLDPTVLTIGFARRFATYKRATLLLRDPDRLRALLLDKERPVQFVFAGKAHPADDPGKELLRAIADFASDPRWRHRFVFIEDLDIEVGRLMYQGVDVWLNNPVRPHEACGTSGMKVVFNGALNCSILDGWWAERYENEVGWAIPTAIRAGSPEERDDIESRNLYRLLEEQIVPLFYNRDGEGLPTAWLDRVRSSMARLAPKVEAGHMLRQYVTEYYEPAARRTAELLADDARAARELATWKRRVRGEWKAVHVLSADEANAVEELGAELEIRAIVDLDGMGPDDVQVQVLHGRVDVAGEVDQPEVTVMHPEPDTPVGHYFTAIPCPNAGTFGYTVRIVPDHPHLDHFTSVGRITWIDGSVPDE